MQKNGQNKLHKVVQEVVQKSVIVTKNRAKSWEYGYNEKYDIIVISKDGTIGDIYEIQGLKIALPKVPKKVNNYHEKWRAKELPKELRYLKTIFDWNKKEQQFKSKWISYGVTIESIAGLLTAAPFTPIIYKAPGAKPPAIAAALSGNCKSPVLVP